MIPSGSSNNLSKLLAQSDILPLETSLTELNCVFIEFWAFVHGVWKRIATKVKLKMIGHRNINTGTNYNSAVKNIWN